MRRETHVRGDRQAGGHVAHARDSNRECEHEWDFHRRADSRACRDQVPRGGTRPKVARCVGLAGPILTTKPDDDLAEHAGIELGSGEELRYGHADDGERRAQRGEGRDV